MTTAPSIVDVRRADDRRDFGNRRAIGDIQNMRLNPFRGQRPQRRA